MTHTKGQQRSVMDTPPGPNPGDPLVNYWVDQAPGRAGPCSQENPEARRGTQPATPTTPARFRSAEACQALNALSRACIEGESRRSTGYRPESRRWRAEQSRPEIPDGSLALNSPLSVHECGSNAAGQRANEGQTRSKLLRIRTRDGHV